MISAMHAMALTLPEPHAIATYPVVAILAVLVVIALMRKLLSLAVIALVVAGLVVAYQGGALDHWVDKGKTAIEQQLPHS